MADDRFGSRFRAKRFCCALVGLVTACSGAGLFLRASAQEAGVPLPEREASARQAALVEALREGLPYVPGELLVRFVPGTRPRDQAAALRTLRAEVSPGDGRWLGDVMHLRNLDITDPAREAAALELQPEVLYAQPNFIRRLHAVPNDPDYRHQWHFEAINLPRAWDINPGGRSDVIVAVLDSGLTTAEVTYGFRIWTGRSFQILPVPLARAHDFDHARVMVGREFVLDGGWRSPSTGQPVLFDADGHGTHVAGTIAQQTNNGIGFAGVAHGVTLLPLKVCWSYWDVQLYFGAIGTPGFVNPDSGGCSDDAIVGALRHAADAGAKVVNMSLGSDDPAPAIGDALHYAVTRGAFVAISAGNEALRGNPVQYPAVYAASLDGATAVGALSRALSRARYSSHGLFVELVAPGGDAASSANHVWQIGPSQADLEFRLLSPRFDRYQSYGISGTSMAAPHVAGLAALLYSQGITKPAAIEAALKRAARDLGPAGRDNEYGYGLVDARAALRGMGLAR